MPEEHKPVDASDPSIRHNPIMTDADMAMKVDPVYNAICQRSGRSGVFRRHLRARLVQADPPRHGPEGEYVGPDVPGEDLIWQDPIPEGSDRLRCGRGESEDRRQRPDRPS
jgi:catalase-peroxidase